MLVSPQLSNILISNKGEGPEEIQMQGNTIKDVAFQKYLDNNMSCCFCPTCYILLTVLQSNANTKKMHSPIQHDQTLLLQEWQDLLDSDLPGKTQEPDP